MTAGTDGVFLGGQPATDFEAAALVVIDALPVGVAVFDTDCRFVLINPVLAAMNGHPVAEHIGRRALEMVRQPFAIELDAIVRRVIATGEAIRDVEVPATPGISGQAQVRLASWLPLRDAAGTVIAVAAVVGDITDRLRAATADERRQRTLESLINALPIPVTLVGDDGRYTVVNPASERLMGIPPSAHLGHAVGELYPPAVVEAVEQVTDSRHGETREVTLEIHRSDGSSADFRITGFRVADEGWGYAVIDDTAVHAARRRMEVLSDITGRLSTIDSLTVLADIVQDVVGVELGALAVGVALVEPGGLRYLAMRPYPPEVVAAWERFPLEARVPATWAIHHREEVWVAGLDALAERFPEGSDVAAALGIDSIGVIPLLAGAEAIGVLTLAWQQRPVRIPDDERQWCRALANVLTPALLRVLRGESDRRIAEVLQRGLLPNAIPDIAWCDLGVGYRAAGEGQVGGDTFDVVELDEHRFAVLIADVCGRGIDAASAASGIRHSLRAALIAGHGPVEALGIADRCLVAGHDGTLPFASAAIAVFTAGNGEPCRVHLSLAGHPPLVVRTAAGAASLVGEPGPLLGLGASALRRCEVQLELGSGDLLVIYTDGLTDTPRPRLNEPDLLRMIEAVPSNDPRTVSSWLVGRTSGPSDQRDDTALVIVRPH